MHTKTFEIKKAGLSWQVTNQDLPNGITQYDAFSRYFEDDTLVTIETLEPEFGSYTLPKTDFDYLKVWASKFFPWIKPEFRNVKYCISNKKVTKRMVFPVPDSIPWGSNEFTVMLYDRVYGLKTLN
jgi:hypothetical protein